MFLSHVGLMMTGLGQSLGFTKCMVSAFCGFVVIGLVLVVYQKASIIIGAFAIVGCLRCPCVFASFRLEQCDPLLCTSSSTLGLHLI